MAAPVSGALAIWLKRWITGVTPEEADDLAIMGGITLDLDDKGIDRD